MLDGPADLSYRSTLLRHEPKQLAEPSFCELYPPSMQNSGYGLASVFAYMALNRPDDFAWVQQAIHKIVPPVNRIRFDRVPRYDGGTGNSEPSNVRILDSMIFDTTTGEGITASAMSEGTLLVLGMLASISNQDNFVLLIDDLDRGLHPKAQDELVAMLRGLLDENPGTQIVATTHSPILLNYLRPEEVRLTTLNPDGTTACGRLTDHPAFEEWKDAMAPGEFWSYVGEQWVRDLPVGRGA